MPYLPFSPSTSPSSSPKTSPSPPSIVLHGTGTGASSKRELYKSTDDIASAYRTRYAQYLASTFNMSVAAALAEADAQLGHTPRRSSGVSEAEVLRES